MLSEHVRASTSIRVERWDAGQVQRAVREAHRRMPPGSIRPGWEPGKTLMDRLGIEPYLVTEDRDCNLVVQTGWVSLLGGIAGTTMTTKFSATQARIGVGTSTTAAAWTQTGLSGDTGAASTTSYFQLVSAAPVVTTGSSPVSLTFTASFGGTVANFAWNEFGTDNWSVSGVTGTGFASNYVFFNRGVSAQSTKPSGQIWAITEIISFGSPSGSGTVT